MRKGFIFLILGIFIALKINNRLLAEVGKRLKGKGALGRNFPFPFPPFTSALPLAKVPFARGLIISTFKLILIKILNKKK